MVCGVAWQGVANSARQRNEVSVASICRQNNTRRHGKFALTSVAIQQIQHGKNGRCLWAKQAQRKWGSVWAGDFSLSLSLSLSRCSHFLARLCVKFKGFFYSFHRSFFSSFCLQKAFFRTFCFFKIFKCFVFGLLCPFCHFERSALAQSEKSIRMLRYTLNLR